MIDSIKRFFREKVTEPATAGGSPDPKRLQIATCALLLEAAHADDDFSAGEREMVAGLVRDRFGLTEAESTELIALAENERLESTDLFQFTRLVGERMDRTRKLAIVESLWRVVYSDGMLEAHEDALMHKLARLLDLRHRELIALKLKVKGSEG